MRTFFMRGGKAFMKACENAKTIELIKNISARKIADENGFEDIDEAKTRAKVKKLLRELRNETELFCPMKDEEILSFIDYCCEAQRRISAAVVRLSKEGTKNER